MKKNTIFKLVFLVTIIFIGCQNKNSVSNENLSEENNQLTTIKINFDNAIPISEGIKVKSSLKFDEENEHIMGCPQQMIVRGDTIFGIDPFSDAGLYAYTSDGNQIFAYCKRGQAPEDMTLPFNMGLNKDEISVFDFMGKKIMSFNKQGQLLSVIDLPQKAISAMKDADKGIWIDYSNQDVDNVKLGWMSTSIDSITPVLTVPEYLKGMTAASMANMVTFNDSILRYMPPLEPRIYNLHQGQAEPVYELDFDGRWPSEEEFISKYSGDDWAIKYDEIPIESKGFVESEEWLVLGFSFEKKLYFIVYDKLNLQTHIFIDSDNSYFGPKALEGSNLYLYRQNDTMEIINLEDQNFQ